MTTGTTPNELARDLSRRLGRTVTAKAVRAWGRAHLARLDDDKYTATVYTSAERTRIVAAFVAASDRRKAQTATKPKVTPRKARGASKRAAIAASAETDATV